MDKDNNYSKADAREEKNANSSSSGEKVGEALGFAAKEAFNLLRTNITFSFAKGNGTKIIGVTSPSPHEGKSFTSVNLAYAFAETGYKVILLEGDLRCPSISKKVGKPLAPGLSNLLVGDETNVIHEGVLHPNLFVITAGDIPPNPTELLGSDRMKATLSLLSERFDYIIVDLPPILTVSDPLIASKYLDGMVVVVKHESTRRSEVAEAVRLLKFSGVHILGFVYNEHGSRAHSHRKGYYYNYNGYYNTSYNNSKRESGSEASK